MSKTLFVVRGVNNEGAWTQYVLAGSPGEALDATLATLTALQSSETRK